MQLIVSGSTQEYIPGGNPSLEEIRLLITKRYLTVLYGQFNLNFPDREHIAAFTSRISGADQAGILDALHEFRFYDMEDAFRNYNADQVYLFKSVFLIYGYLQEQPTERSKENAARLYDKLILEKKLPTEIAGVLYFLREQYLDEYYQPMLNKLVALKLLCKARILGLPTDYATYFTALNHNETSRMLLGRDPDETTKVWQMIQEDKRNRMFNSYNMPT